MTNDSQIWVPEEGPTIEEIMALAMRGTEIQMLVADLDDGRRVTLDWLDGDVARWRMTDGVRTMLCTVRMYDDGTVAETLDIEWLS